MLIVNVVEVGLKEKLVAKKRNLFDLMLLTFAGLQ